MAIKPLRRYRVTALFLVTVWLLYAVRLSVEFIYDEELALSLFTVHFSNLEYVWTWITAPLGHGNLAHLIFNTMLALYIIPPIERDFGPTKTTVIYIIGGATCAVIGTVLVVFVRMPFLSNATDVGGVGSSIGLFVLLGLTLRQYWSHQNPPFADIGINIENSTLFAVLLIGSVGGIVFDIWRIWAGFPFPGLGHHYHAVGLVLGALIMEMAPLQKDL